MAVEDVKTRGRRPQGEQRREQIVEAALAVVGRVGPEALTHRLVAAEAGVGLGATTYWFASKQELVLEAMWLAARRDIARMERARPAVATWTRATIAGELAAQLREQLTCGRTALVADYGLWMEAARQPELREVAAARTSAFEAHLAGALRSIGAPDPERDAPLLAAALDGLALRELTSAAPLDEAALAALLDRQIDALAR